MKFPIKLTPTLLIIILLSVAGSLAIYYSTYWGPWAYSDSTGYIVSARNLLAGRGLGYSAPSGDFIPYTLHPPFYPLALSAMGLIGFDLLAAARWLNIILFGATIFLAGAFTYAQFRSSWLAISLSAALLTIPTLVDVSSGAMSELLFLFTSTLGISILILYVGQRKRYQLILSAISIAFAFLTRYPGVVTVVACIIVLWVAGRISWKQRLHDVLVFSSISITPTAIWLIWIYFQTRSLGARDYNLTLNIGANSITLRKQLMEIFWSWLPFREYLPPYSYNFSRDILIFLIVVTFILSSLIIYNNFQSRKSGHNSAQGSTFAFLWGLFSLGNILLLAASFIFTRPLPDLNLRTLLPVQFGLVFAILALLAAVIHEFRLPHAVGWAGAALVLVMIFPNTQASWNIISQNYRFGAGFTNHAWHNNLTLQVLSNLPADIPIITNEAAAVLLHLDRPAYDFYTPPCSQSGELRYGDDPLDPVQNIFRQDGAALVFFYPYCGVQSESWYSATMAQLQSLTQNLTRTFSSCDGAIYFYPSVGQ
jgi:hypothetical protein